LCTDLSLADNGVQSEEFRLGRSLPDEENRPGGSERVSFFTRRLMPGTEYVQNQTRFAWISSGALRRPANARASQRFLIPLLFTHNSPLEQSAAYRRLVRDQDGRRHITTTGIAGHGASRFPSVEIDGFNIELKDKAGFIGDRASKGGFREILERWRKPLADSRSANTFRCSTRQPGNACEKRIPSGAGLGGVP
jgi:hypothetical protein